MTPFMRSLPPHELEKQPIVVGSPQPEGTLKFKASGKRSRRVKCCQVTITLVLILVVLIGAFFATAELLSKPGHESSSQDTKSAQTRRRIQLTRRAMPALSARMKSATDKWSKQELIDYIQLATAFSAASYTVAHAPQTCIAPVQSSLIKPLTSKFARGYIARDDQAQLLVVAFQGITGLRTIWQALDTNLVELDVTSTNSTTPEMMVQKGVQDMYKSLEGDLLRTIAHEMTSVPEHAILITGHNIGGSMAILAGLHLKSLYKTRLVSVVTQGQAKTFNEAAVQHIDAIFAPGRYGLVRATHSIDGIVNAQSPFVNRKAVHHSGEVWHFKDAATQDTVVVCQGREDVSCSASYTEAAFQIMPPSLPWSAESLHYFDVEMMSKKSVHCGGPGGLGPYKLLTSRRPLKILPTAGVIARAV